MAANPKPIVQDFRAFNVAIPVKNSVVLNKIGELNKTMENKYFKNFCALETNTYFPIEIEKRHQALLKKFNYDQMHAAALQALSTAVGRPGFDGCASFTLKKTFIDIPCIVRSSDNLLRTYFPVSTPSVKTRSTRTCERVKAGLEKMKRLKTTNVLTDTAVTHDGQHADFASLKDCEAEEKFEDIVIHKQAKPKSGLGLIEVASPNTEAMLNQLEAESGSGSAPPSIPIEVIPEKDPEGARALNFVEEPNSTRAPLQRTRSQDDFQMFDDDDALGINPAYSHQTPQPQCFPFSQHLIQQTPQHQMYSFGGRPTNTSFMENSDRPSSLVTHHSRASGSFFPFPQNNAQQSGQHLLQPPAFEEFTQFDQSAFTPLPPQYQEFVHIEQHLPATVQHAEFFGKTGFEGGNDLLLDGEFFV